MNNNKRRKVILAALIILLLVCVTIGYARIATTLTINGTTGIRDNTWDIHFENLEVTKGEEFATAEGQAKIQADKTKIVYEVTLPLPGNVYEFETDIVNAGTIPAELEDIEITMAGVDSVNNQTRPVTKNVYYEAGDILKDKDGNTLYQNGHDGEDGYERIAVGGEPVLNSDGTQKTQIVTETLNDLVLYGVKYVDDTDLTKKDDTATPKVKGDVLKPKSGPTYDSESSRRIKVWVKYNDDILPLQLPSTPFTATLTVVLHYAQESR